MGANYSKRPTKQHVNSRFFVRQMPIKGLIFLADTILKRLRCTSNRRHDPDVSIEGHDA